LLEIAVATAMLIVLLATSVKLIAVLAGQQRAAERRALALRTLDNLVEQFENLPWDEATAEAAQRLTLPESVTSFLPSAAVQAAVFEEPAPVPARRVTIELTWIPAGGRPPSTARLTTWVFPDSSPQ
jgi:hypothetical protein